LDPGSGGVELPMNHLPQRYRPTPVIEPLLFEIVS
jgi:hypothetical protein